MSVPGSEPAPSTAPCQPAVAADAEGAGLDCDVLVIGGGPAGSTAATLLAQQGRRVVLLEKARHPRFHIGESLLPANAALFERLGVLAEVEAIGMPKYGAEFIAPGHDHPGRIDFAEGWNPALSLAWQVRRSELDALLIRNAARHGVAVHENCRVGGVAFGTAGGAVEVESTDEAGVVRRWRARYVVDASGRDTLLANQFGTKRKHRKHNSAALFGHFRNARRLPGREAGNISVYWFQHGWIWFIPLADGTTSIGAVCWPHYLKSRDLPLEAFFRRTIESVPRLAERLAQAELVDGQVWATGNYAYASRVSCGKGWQMLGDAYAFVDPVFSSGVYLAMESAVAGARLAQAELDRPSEAAAERRRFDAHMKKGPREFTWFILRMTSPAMRWLFLNPTNVLRVKEAVIALLAGDIFGSTPIWRSLRWFKVIYYIASLLRGPEALAAWWRRRELIRDVGPVKGENVLADAR